MEEYGGWLDTVGELLWDGVDIREFGVIGCFLGE